MGKFEIKKLPQNFRFLFTLKEIKEIESFAGIKFKNVTNGNLTNSKKFDNDAYIQSSFRGFTIHAIKSKSEWEFSLRQDGFRAELLPNMYEEELKISLSEKIKDYLNQVSHSKDTDCYTNPQLWSLVMITENKVNVSWEESK